MNKRIIIYLAVICALGFALRVVIPYQLVFSGDFVSFLETDAYNRMDCVKAMLSMPFWDATIYAIQNNGLFPWIITLFSYVLPYEIVGAWLPPVLAVLAIIVVYFIGKELFNPTVGIFSALFVSVIPSEFLHRSLIGYTDHHVMEVLLMCLWIYFLIRLLKYRKPFSLDSLFFALSLTLYMLNWASGMYLSGAVIIAVIITFIICNIVTKQHWHDSLSAIVLPALLGLALYLSMGGYRQLMWFIPVSSQAIPAIQTGEIIQTVTSNPATRTISELMPLLFPYGSFSLIVVLTNLHLFVITSGVSVYYLWLQRNKVTLLLAIWSLIMLVITLNERRFLYYLTVNIAILSAFAIYEFSKRIKGKLSYNMACMAVPLVMVSLPYSAAIGGLSQFQMDKEWHDALTCLKQQPASGYVTAWGDYGHWIHYVSEKTPNNLPGPGGNNTANLFLSTNDADAKDCLEKLQSGYVIVNQELLGRVYFAIEQNASSKPDKSSTLLYHLYEKDGIPAYLELVYESTTIKIYKVKWE